MKQAGCEKKPHTHPTLKNIAGYRVNVLVMFCGSIGNFPQKEYKMMSQYVMPEILKRVGFLCKIIFTYICQVSIVYHISGVNWTASLISDKNFLYLNIAAGKKKVRTNTGLGSPVEKIL